MVRTPSVDKNGIRRGAWSEEEDNILKAYILKNGHSNWRQLPRFAGLARCGKSCRLRWKNYLKPGLRRGNYTKEEVEQIIKLREEFGNKWSLIASTMPGRTDNEIKNYWHTHLKNPTKQGPKSIISTHKNVENLDQMHVIDCMEQISSSMSLSHESIQMKEFDTNSKAVDSFPEVSSSMNCNSSSFEHWDYSIDSFQAFEEFWHQPFLFNTSNDIITQSVADPRFWTEPFILDSSNSQISDSSIYNLGLNDESVARNFGSFVSESQILPSTSCNSALLSGVEHWSSWTQPILMDTSSNDSIFSTAISNSEECMAPFMPLATGDTWLDRELILNPGYYQEMQWSLPLDPLPDDMDLINL